MSNLLVRWLNDEVKLSKRVTSLEADFADGFLFGELLSKFNAQPDFARFRTGSNPELKIDNFVRLEPTMRNLGVPFDSKSVNAIMTEKRGEAAQLLYALRGVLEVLAAGGDRTATTGALAATAKGGKTAKGPVAAGIVRRSVEEKAAYEQAQHQVRLGGDGGA